MRRTSLTLLFSLGVLALSAWAWAEPRSVNIECDDPKIEAITRELFTRNHIVIDKTSPRRLVVRATRTQIVMRFEEPGQPSQERMVERDASSAVTQDTAAHIALSLVEPEALVQEPSAPPPATTSTPAPSASSAPPEPPKPPEPKAAEPPKPEPKPEKATVVEASLAARDDDKALKVSPFHAAFVGASLGVGTFSPSRVGFLPRVEGGVRFRGLLQPQLVLSVGYIFGEDREVQGVGTKATWVPIRLQGGISPRLSDSVLASLSLRLGVDYLRVATRALDPFTRPSEVVERAQPMLGLGSAIQGYVWGNLSLVGCAHLDFDLAPRAFVVTEPQSPKNVFATSRVQAEVSFGVRFDFAGDPR